MTEKEFGRLADDVRQLRDVLDTLLTRIAESGASPQELVRSSRCASWSIRICTNELKTICARSSLDDDGSSE